MLRLLPGRRLIDITDDLFRFFKHLPWQKEVEAALEVDLTSGAWTEIVFLPLNCHCSSCVVGLAFAGPIGGVMAEVKVDVTSGARCIEESLGVIRG